MGNEKKESLSVDVGVQGDYVVVYLRGSANIESANMMQKELDKVVLGEGKHILINCSQFFFVSSSGLRVFLKFSKDIAARGKTLGFFSLNRDVEKVFSISGITKLFSIYPDKEAAIEDIKERFE